MSETQAPSTSILTSSVNVPRVTIKYCTQCRWMLRAAYFAQELLSTFSTQIGEVALIPATGGIFTVTVIHPDGEAVGGASEIKTKETVLWDRKTEGGFPETKQLKSLLRNIIDPTRDLGHVDRALKKNKDSSSNVTNAESTTATSVGSIPNTPSTATAATAALQEAATTSHDAGEVKEVCEDCQ